MAEFLDWRAFAAERERANEMKRHRMSLRNARIAQENEMEEKERQRSFEAEQNRIKANREQANIDRSFNWEREKFLEEENNKTRRWEQEFKQKELIANRELAIKEAEMQMKQTQFQNDLRETEKKESQRQMLNAYTRMFNLKANEIDVDQDGKAETIRAMSPEDIQTINKYNNLNGDKTNYTKIFSFPDGSILGETSEGQVNMIMSSSQAYNTFKDAWGEDKVLGYTNNLYANNHNIYMQEKSRQAMLSQATLETLMRQRQYYLAQKSELLGKDGSTTEKSLAEAMSPVQSALDDSKKQMIEQLDGYIKDIDERIKVFDPSFDLNGNSGRVEPEVKKEQVIPKHTQEQSVVEEKKQPMTSDTNVETPEPEDIDLNVPLYSEDIRHERAAIAGLGKADRHALTNTNKAYVEPDPSNSWLLDFVDQNEDLKREVSSGLKNRVGVSNDLILNPIEKIWEKYFDKKTGGFGLNKNDRIDLLGLVFEDKEKQKIFDTECLPLLKSYNKDDLEVGLNLYKKLTQKGGIPNYKAEYLIYMEEAKRRYHNTDDIKTKVHLVRMMHHMENSLKKLDTRLKDEIDKL